MSKTNEQIVAEALSTNWRNTHTNESLGKQNMLAAGAIAALTAANRLVGEPTDEQVERSAKAIADCHNPGMFEQYPENWRIEARAALKAAGIVPQAPSEALYCAVHGDLLAAPRSWRCANAPEGHELAAAPPVFDVDKIDRPALVKLLLAHGHVEWDEFDAETMAETVIAHLTEGSGS